jgi:hypothetical protein
VRNVSLNDRSSAFDRLLALICWLFLPVAMIILLIPGAAEPVRRHARAAWFWLLIGIGLYVVLRFVGGMVGIYALGNLDEPLLNPISIAAGAIYSFGVLLNCLAAIAGRGPLLGR